MSEPIPLKTTRWKCPHCSYVKVRKETTVKHIARCWQNPDAKGCKTCANYSPAEECNCGGPGCYRMLLEECAEGIELVPSLKVHCPKWEADRG